MAKITKVEFIEFLEETLQAIKDDDSFEGSIRYQISGHDEFEVGAFVRVGNSMGQGGSMLIEAAKDPNQPKVGSLVFHEMDKELPPVGNKYYFTIFDGKLTQSRWNGEWCDRLGLFYPSDVQKRFTHWADPKEFILQEG